MYTNGHSRSLAGGAAVLAGVAVLILVPQAPADTAVTTPYEHAQPVSNNALFGIRFTSSADLFVTALGVIDPWHVGSQPDTQVGLWDDDSHTLLASAVVPGGTAAPLINGSRFVDIPPLTLTAGEAYRLAMYIPAGPNGYFMGNEGSVNPLITVSTVYFDPFIGHLAYPTANPYPPSVAPPYGPNFVFTAAPEPASLVGLALSLVLWRRR